jgi:hypothetical protein
MFPPPVIKSKSGSVAVTGVLAFLQRVRRHLSCVVDCSGGNASAGNMFLAAMHSNPTAWGDTYERAIANYAHSVHLNHVQAAGPASTAGRRPVECSVDYFPASRRQ